MKGLLNPHHSAIAQLFLLKKKFMVRYGTVIVQFCAHLCLIVNRFVHTVVEQQCITIEL